MPDVVVPGGRSIGGVQPPIGNNPMFQSWHGGGFGGLPGTGYGLASQRLRSGRKPGLDPLQVNLYNSYPGFNALNLSPEQIPQEFRHLFGGGQQQIQGLSDAAQRLNGMVPAQRQPSSSQGFGIAPPANLRKLLLQRMNGGMINGL